jgi:hypothetical protein
LNSLHFHIPWAVVSNNVVTRRVGRMIMPNPEAVRQKDVIRGYAWLFVQQHRWEIPPAAALYITAWNTRKDTDNCVKVISDALNGVAWKDDRDVIELHVEKRRDEGGERYDVRVEPRGALVKPKRKKAS